MCIGSPAQDTPCRRSYDCHKGTVASVSSVLLREQKQGLSKLLAYPNFTRAACITRVSRTPMDLSLS